MWDDLVSVCTTTPATATPAHSVQQRERCPSRVCRSASRDTYDAEVCHGGEILYFCSASTKKKKKEDRNQNTGRREGGKGNISPASDAPTSPQPTSPKFKSTLCFSALKTSLLDIVSGGGAVMRWIWPCPGVETDGGGDAAGMNSMRSQRFCLRAC